MIWFLLGYEIYITIKFRGCHYWVTNNRKREISSAKSVVLEDKPLAKSLIHIKNNNGPRMESWGTPALTLAHKEDCPFNKIVCFLFAKKCFKTFNKLPDDPFYWI